LLAISNAKKIPLDSKILDAQKNYLENAPGKAQIKQK